MTPRRFVAILALPCLAAAAFVFSRAAPVHGAEAPAPAATIPAPQDYRRWIYLTSGLDMTYNATSGLPLPPDHDGQFDNVFVDPTAYSRFVQTGTWPTGTTFLLENRAARRNVSINKGGRTQGAEITGIELHVKTSAGLAFYARQKDGTEKLIPRPAGCYTCHEAHAAVDTTFVQFYPTLLPIAEAKGVLSPAYVTETRAAVHD